MIITFPSSLSGPSLNAAGAITSAGAWSALLESGPSAAMVRVAQFTPDVGSVTDPRTGAVFAIPTGWSGADPALVAVGGRIPLGRVGLATVEPFGAIHYARLPPGVVMADRVSPVTTDPAVAARLRRQYGVDFVGADPGPPPDEGVSISFTVTALFLEVVGGTPGDFTFRLESR